MAPIFGSAVVVGAIVGLVMLPDLADMGAPPFAMPFVSMSLACGAVSCIFTKLPTSSISPSSLPTFSSSAGSAVLA